MTKINLSELEHEAIETKETKVNFVYMEADPDDVLALIRVARLAKEINDEYKHDLGHFSPMLEEALKEIEG